jgi:AraC-like DNA-binding protein
METVNDAANVVRVFCHVDMTGATLPNGSTSKEGCMVEELGVSRALVARATWLPQAAGARRQWDGRSGVCRDVGPHTVSEYGQQSSFQAKAQSVTAHRTRTYWTTDEICRVPAFPLQAIAWEKEAARVTFALDPVLLADTAHRVIPRVTGEVVWVHGQEQTASPTPSVHPALLVHALDASLQGERITIVPSLPIRDPLLHHIALVLQATIAAEDAAGHLYAASLADALVVHFLRRYAASRPSLRQVTGGLAPSKLSRTTAYIKAHLEQALSLAELAAVAQTSPAHFARAFKQATGQTLHRYVTTCRMECAKHLLTETTLLLHEVGAQVGCADQSHFTALFRQHVSMTPKVYRNTTRSTLL